MIIYGAFLCLGWLFLSMKKRKVLYDLWRGISG
jgi:hypothetical protein